MPLFTLCKTSKHVFPQGGRRIVKKVDKIGFSPDLIVLRGLAQRIPGKRVQLVR